MSTREVVSIQPYMLDPESEPASWSKKTQKTANFVKMTEVRLKLTANMISHEFIIKAWPKQLLPSCQFWKAAGNMLSLKECWKFLLDFSDSATERTNTLHAWTETKRSRGTLFVCHHSSPRGSERREVCVHVREGLWQSPPWFTFRATLTCF